MAGIAVCKRLLPYLPQNGAPQPTTPDPEVLSATFFVVEVGVCPLVTNVVFGAPQ